MILFRWLVSALLVLSISAFAPRPALRLSSPTTALQMPPRTPTHLRPRAERAQGGAHALGPTRPPALSAAAAGGEVEERVPAWLRRLRACSEVQCLLALAVATAALFAALVATRDRPGPPLRVLREVRDRDAMRAHMWTSSLLSSEVSRDV